MARQYGLTFGALSICDCAGVTSERDFVRRLIASRPAAANRETELVQIQCALSEAGASVEDDFQAALHVWSADVASTAVIFENVEALTESLALRKLFERALSMTPESCTLIVCSRRSPGIQVSRIAPPHRVITLRSEDLAFDRGEIASVFARAKVSQAILADVEAKTGGWPIGVLMLRRLATEGRLADSLQHLDDVALDDMHGYLANEVFALLEPKERDTVIACAAFGTAKPADVAAALDLEREEEAAERLRSVAPLTATGLDGTFSVHPLLAAAIERRYRAARIEFALTAAQKFEANSDFFAAAKILHRLGKLDDAARMLCAEASVGNRKPSTGFGALLAALDPQTLARHPVLRGLMTYSQRFRVDPHLLREEAFAVWRTIRDADFGLRCNIGNPLARIMYETGRFDEAETLLRALETEAGGIPDIPRNLGEAYIARTLACVLARSGRLAEAEPYFQKGYFTIPGAEFVLSRASIERAIIERMHGRFEDERRHFDQAIALATEQNATVHIACALAEATFGSWFAGDDAAALGYVRSLDERVVRDAMRGFAHFCSVVYGENEAHPNGTEQPNWLACAHLIASAASSGPDRLRHSEAAKKSADESNDRFLRLLASLALGLAAPAQRGERFADALLHAAAIEAPAVRAAVAALIADQNDVGLLSGFIARFRTHKPDEQEPIRIDVLSLRVFRGGVLVALPQRELAVLLALARQRKFYARAEIASFVWPDFEEIAAREAFNSCLYRLRQRLPDVVMYTREGYRLNDHVRVDLRELEHWIAALPLRRELLEQERVVFRALYERLRATAMPNDDDETWAWLTPIFLRADDMRRTVAERLANDALRRCDHSEALLLARQLVADDPCDEAAREISIRAHLGLGKRGEAIREFRQYRDVLYRELEARPSAALARLIHEESFGVASPAEASADRALPMYG